MSDEIVNGGEASIESSAPESTGELSTETVEASAEDGAVIKSESSEEVSEEVSASSEDEEIEVNASSEEEFEQEVKEAIEEGASEEQVKDMIRRFTLKVNGKELVKEIDLSDEEAIKKELQLAYAGRQSMQELAEIKKMYTNEIRRLMDSPFEVMQEIDPNFNPMDLVKNYVEEQYQESQLTPEQKAAREQEMAYKKAIEENQRLKAEFEAQRQEKELKELEAQIENDILEAINSDPELEVDPDTIALVAENLIWAEDNGFHDMTAKDVLPTVKDQLRDQFRRAGSKFKSTAALKEYMGQDLLDKLREERIQQAKQIKSATSLKSTPSAKPVKDKEAKEEEKIKLSSLFR
jgi:hypothetical protein